jgi:carbon-monoxide dehydrogenase medium subunit
MAARDFFQGTWVTARRSDELLTRVDIPLVPGLRAGFAELARRPGDFALAGAFVGVRLDGDVISECRIALCGVADIPLRLPGAELALVGRSFADVDGLIADAVRTEIDPSDGVDCSGPYRRHVAGTVARRAWTSAMGDTGLLVAS